MWRIYIYICCRVENPSKNCPFLSWKSVQVFFVFVFLFFKYLLLSAGRMSFFKNKKRIKGKKKTTFCVENPSNFVAQHNWTDSQRNLGRIFNSTLLLIWAFFPFRKSAETTIFIVFSAKKKKKLIPPQKLRNAICEHNCANCFFSVFSAFLHFWVFAVSGFFGGSFFERNGKTKQRQIQNKTTQKKQKRKKDHKMQTRRPLSLVTKTTT